MAVYDIDQRDFLCEPGARMCSIPPDWQLIIDITRNTIAIGKIRYG